MRSTTVREELVVALFEDAADIVKRLEALAPVMADSRAQPRKPLSRTQRRRQPELRNRAQGGTRARRKAARYGRLN